MIRRQIHYRLTHKLIRLFFCNAVSGRGTVGHSGLDGLVSSRIGATTAGRERLERAIESSQVNGGTAFKAASPPPHIEETSLRRSSATVSLPTNR